MTLKSKLSNENKQYILENYLTETKENILLNLPNTISWKLVQGFATRNGLKGRKVDKRSAKFELKHDDLIKQLYPEANWKELLSKIPFKKEAIIRRAERIGIKRNLSRIHTKRFLPSGQSIIEKSRESGIPYSTLHQNHKKYGAETVQEYINSGRTKNILEIRFENLFKDILPIERWNKFIRDYNIHFKPDFRIKYNNKELFLNIDGLWYHHEGYRDKNYHYNFHKAFFEKGIRLMQFRSNELDESEDLIKSMVYNYFNVNTEVLYARSCRIEIIDSDEARQFLQENHLMKSRDCKFIGLISKDNKLTSLLGYRKYNDILEIDRFCTRKYTRIIGGFSKLVSYLSKVEVPKAIVSFCDLRYATGSSYVQTGFKADGIHIGWRWTNGIRTYARQQCKANMDKRGLSQDEYAKERGWHKVYDAGQIRYIKMFSKVDIKNLEPLDEIQKTKKIFWKNEELQYLKKLTYQFSSRKQIIQDFQEKYNKSENAIIRKISDLELTNPKRININVGDVFSYWTTIEKYNTEKKVRCRCICGIERDIAKSRLTKGSSKSCGCKKNDICTETSLKKYGVKRASQLEETKQKMYKTKKIMISNQNKFHKK